jgi:hypothetical protein
LTNKCSSNCRKGQYERKFAEWGWKKNLTAADLQYVLTRLHEREAAGKKSEATLEVGAFKMVIPAERLRKGKYRSRMIDINNASKLLPLNEGTTSDSSQRPQRARPLGSHPSPH